MLDVVALRHYIERAGIRQRDLYEVWGVRRSNVSQKLSGERNMTLTEIIQLATILKLTKEEFVQLFGDLENVKQAQEFRKFWNKL